MKTYEEMARDVLKRRDEELTSITQTSQLNPPPEVVYPGVMKKRSWIPKIAMIAIPCAAAVLVGVVGINVWKNVRGSQSPNLTPGIAAADEDGEYLFQDFVREEPESIYKGGKTEIYINEIEDWNGYSFPMLSAEDFRPIDDDKINNYYGMEFDRLSRIYPEWESEHEPFGTYEHDEDDGFAASHRIIYTINRIGYTTDNNGIVCINASIIEKYDAATAENPKPSVINGFDAMVYKCNRIGNYAADIDMGSARVTISALDMDEDEFLNILDVYTAADEGGEDNQNNNQNQNHNQTMEDKIVVYDGRPDFLMSQNPAEPHYKDFEGARWRIYSRDELNALYGIDFACLSELHPDWLKWFAERGFGVYYNVDDNAVGGDIPENREIVEARNAVSYVTTEGASIAVIARLEEFPDNDIEHSVINGYDSVIFRLYKSDDSDLHDLGAAIDMDGTMVYITAYSQTEDDFIALLREYTSNASKYTKPAYIEPIDITLFDAVDPFDERITYDVSWDVESCWWALKTAAEPYGLYDTDNLETTLGDLKDFLGTDKLPVDETFKSNFERYQYDGKFCCLTAEGAKAYSPVDGKVVAACEGWYNRGLGRAVAVEFGDGKVFIIGHLDEINVEVGDTVTAGQALGVCGHSGRVFVDDPPLFTLIAMQKVD